MERKTSAALILPQCHSAFVQVTHSHSHLNPGDYTMCAQTALLAQTFHASLHPGSISGGDGVGIIPEGTLSLTS